MVTGKNNNNNDLVAETINNGSISFLSELLINQGFVSGEEKKDNMTAENAKQTTEINTNEYESLISDILKDPHSHSYSYIVLIEFCTLRYSYLLQCFTW